MPSSVLQLLALLVLVVFAANGHHAEDHDDEEIKRSQFGHSPDHLLTENDGDLKAIGIDGNERTITIPPITFNPTPVTAVFPTLRPTGRPVIVTPGPVVTASGPPAEIIRPPTPPSADSVCGRKGRCYQWFDEEWQLGLDGFTQCNAGDLRRARRYCCIP